jgi:hypothetical protein
MIRTPNFNLVYESKIRGRRFLSSCFINQMDITSGEFPIFIYVYGCRYV